MKCSSNRFGADHGTVCRGSACIGISIGLLPGRLDRGRLRGPMKENLRGDRDFEVLRIHDVEGEAGRVGGWRRMLPATLQFLITMIACAINKLDYTQEEVRVLPPPSGACRATAPTTIARASRPSITVLPDSRSNARPATRRGGSGRPVSTSIAAASRSPRARTTGFGASRATRACRA